MPTNTPTHSEFIICPRCLNICKAAVELTIPFATYIHHCEHCQYIIMESEWDGVSAEDLLVYPMAASLTVKSNLAKS